MLNVAALAVQCGLYADREVLAAIVRVESSGNPYALAVNGDVELVRNPRDREEAVAMARWLQERGYNFDAGLAQVNSANLPRLGLDAASVFEPCPNLRAASRVLHECHERALARTSGAGRDGAVAAALSCYNTGDFARGVRNGYVSAVRSHGSESLGIRAALDAEATSDRRGVKRERIPLGRPGVAHRRTAEDVFANARADAFKDVPRAASPMRPQRNEPRCVERVP